MKGFCFRMMLLAVAAVLAGTGMAGAQTWKCGSYSYPDRITATLVGKTMTMICTWEGGADLGDCAGEVRWENAINSVDTLLISGEGSIGADPNWFDQFKNLKWIDIEKSVGYHAGSYTNYSMISIDGILYSDDSSHIWRYPRGRIGAYTVPNGVTSIGSETNGYSSNKGAFEGCTGLTSINIPNSVTSIGSAFMGCTGLISINIPKSVKSIGSHCFDGCTNLASVLLPDSMSGGIGDNTFRNCSSLKSITIPKGVKTIGWGAFENCTQLSSIVIPKSVTDTKADSTVKNGRLPAAFSACTSLTSIVLGNGSAVKLGHSTYGIPFDKLSKLEFLAVDSGNIFWYSVCPNLTKLILGNGVKTIGTEAFKGSTKLSTLSIPNTVDTIGPRAFSGCTRLTSVTIGAGVKSIGSQAFKDCAGLMSLTSLASDPPKLFIPQNSSQAQSATFYGVDKSLCKLSVEQFNIGPYRAADGWKEFTNIEAIQFASVPVVDISGAPVSFRVGASLPLTATVVPANATNKAITWSVVETGQTGAEISGGSLSASAPGTVVVRAAIPSGAITGVDFERYFFITAEPSEDSAAVSVSSRDRVIPSAVTAGVSAVAPVSRLSAEFAAGPNPVGALRATPLQFFYSGAAIKSAALYVYDASGNIVKRISVSDKASVGVQSKRHVGSWDLKDKKGRTVSAGTYLLKGAVKTRDGKSEKVSAVVGVR